MWPVNENRENVDIKQTVIQICTLIKIFLDILTFYYKNCHFACKLQTVIQICTLIKIFLDILTFYYKNCHFTRHQQCLVCTDISSILFQSVFENTFIST
jgi:hypothetical protein